MFHEPCVRGEKNADLAPGSVFASGKDIRSAKNADLRTEISGGRHRTGSRRPGNSKETARCTYTSQGVFFQLPTRPDSGSFCGALRHFSLKYVSIPAEKCLAQRKNPSLPVTSRVGRIHPSNTGLLTCVRGSLPASTAYLLTGSLLQWRTFVQTGKTRFGVSSRAQHRSCRQMPSSSRSCRTLCVWLCGIGVYYGISHIFSFSRCNVPRDSRSSAAGFRPQRAKGRPFAYEPLLSYYTRWIAFFQAVSSKKHKGTDDRIGAYQYFVRAYGASLRWQCTK